MPAQEMDIAEGAPYDHADHGRVRVVLYDGETVVWEHESETVGGEPLTRRETEAEFRDAADPEPITVELPTATATVDTNLM